MSRKKYGGNNAGAAPSLALMSPPDDAALTRGSAAWLVATVKATQLRRERLKQIAGATRAKPPRLALSQAFGIFPAGADNTFP